MFLFIFFFVPRLIEATEFEDFIENQKKEGRNYVAKYLSSPVVQSLAADVSGNGAKDAVRISYIGSWGVSVSSVRPQDKNWLLENYGSEIKNSDNSVSIKWTNHRGKSLKGSDFSKQFNIQLFRKEIENFCEINTGGAEKLIVIDGVDVVVEIISTGKYSLYLIEASKYNKFFERLPIALRSGILSVDSIDPK